MTEGCLMVLYKIVSAGHDFPFAHIAIRARASFLNNREATKLIINTAIGTTKLIKICILVSGPLGYYTIKSRLFDLERCLEALSEPSDPLPFLGNPPVEVL